jgi:hypothetical protein
MVDMCERASSGGWPEVGGEAADEDSTEEEEEHEEGEWHWRVMLSHVTRKAS